MTKVKNSNRTSTPITPTVITEEFQLVKLVQEKDLSAKTINNRGLVQIEKDENGLIMLNKLELNESNQWINSVKLTSASFHRAIVENITVSKVSVIHQILQAHVTNAVQQSDVNAHTYFNNSMDDIDDLVADFKVNNIEIMKQYSTTSGPNVWNTPIDIYNLNGSNAQVINKSINLREENNVGEQSYDF